MIDLLFQIPPFVWIALGVFSVVLSAVAYLILLERKTASWTQDRIGPNRVGPLGLLQPAADGLKFVLKEDYRPRGADKILFTVAPALMMAVIVVALAAIPWGGWVQRTMTSGPASYSPVPAGAEIVSRRAIDSSPPVDEITYRYPFQIANLNLGVLFILAVLSLAVYGIVVGGWASNNKYSFLGGLRATASMISYEIPLGLSVLAIVVMFGTLDLGVIVSQQAHYWRGWMPAWNVFAQPLGFVMFLICIHAEANRAPFDMAEAEQELVGGYHTEYSSMRFALFFLGEYAGMIVTSAVCVALFFGGWHLPWIEWAWPALAGDPTNPAVTTSLWAAIARAGIFFAKTILIIFIFMWARWSLPRFRFDQLMNLAWRAMIPITLVLLVGTAVAIYLAGGNRPANLRLPGKLALLLLGLNVAIVIFFMIVSLIVPAPLATNRRLAIANSRFSSTTRTTP